MPHRDTFYINNKMSTSLEYYIRDCKTFDDFEKKYSDEFLDEDARVGNYLDELLYKYEKNQATVSELAGLNRSYCGNIIRGVTKNPDRDVLIKICLAIGTTFEECQYLLKYAGYAPLYVRRKRDVIIWFGFIKGKGIGDINDDLNKRGLAPLIK